ncbi:MAG: type VI secretion system protein TssA [Bryobacteraceae bacterium]
MPLPGNLLDPIPGPSPCGENLYYSPVYDKIKEARRQEEEIPQGEWRHEVKKADYVQVIKLTTDALTKKTKDLQLAAWLTEALLKQHGFDGLADGLDLLRGLIENFWDGLYPELEDGDAELRATPLEWVGTRLDEAARQVPITESGLSWLAYKDSRSVPYEADASGNEAKSKLREAALADGKLTPEEFDDAFAATPTEFSTAQQAGLGRVLEALEALGHVSDERFGDAAPSFGPLRNAIEDIQQTIRILLAKRGVVSPAETPPAAEEAGIWQAPAAQAAAHVAPAPSPEPLAAEPADEADAIQRIASAAEYLRKQSPYSPVPYLLLRGLRWGELRAGGTGLDEALLEAPPTEVRQRLKKAALDGQWEEVLGTAESAMATPCGRGWLDLQRYVVRACEELGSWYEPIAQAVRAELKTLLNDYPQLRSATMMDDTPTANPETQAWLETFLAAPEPQEGAAAPSAAAPAAQETAPAKDVYDLAMEAVRQKRPQEAIELLSQEIAKARSGRLRFQRKIQLAQVCMASGHENVAYPILEEIGKEIEQRNLEDWEAPDLLAQPLVLLLRCLNKLGTSPEDRQRIYARICRLDPIQALSCTK